MAQELAISTYTDRVIEAELETQCEKKSKDQINSHKEVIPFQNGCLHFIDAQPISANGIPLDCMVGRLNCDYHENLDQLIQQNPHCVEAMNKLLYSQANRNKDNLAFLLCFIGSGVAVVTPPKVAMLMIDLGGAGKTTTLNFLLKSLSGKYVCFS